MFSVIEGTTDLAKLVTVVHLLSLLLFICSKLKAGNNPDEGNSDISRARSDDIDVDLQYERQVGILTIRYIIFCL